MEKGIVSFAAGSDFFLIKQKYKKDHLPNNSVSNNEFLALIYQYCRI
jgi:hypothetical protein